MKFPTFLLERWQSTNENTVEYNLSESGVQPLTLGELGISADDLAACRLGYGHSNCTERFRSLVASLYRDASERNVLATIGCAEANLISILRLVEPADEVAVVLPNYMQTYGLIHGLGARVAPVWLRPENQWRLDPDDLAAKATAQTKLITMCNPNNPTGSVLDRNGFGNDAPYLLAGLQRVDEVLSGE